MPQANYPGGSYSKRTNIAVTAGSTVYFNVGANGGNTWFNTSNVAPTSSSSTSSACLAVGGNTTAASQVAANCGNVKYAGGDGRVTTGNTLTAQGGPAGPNGAGADVGDPYTNTGYSIGASGPYLFCQGGGANGGFQGSLGVPAYGRSGSGTDGMGSRYISGTLTQGTIDSLGNYKYYSNIITDTYTTPNGISWGPKGGGATTGVSTCAGPAWGLIPISGFVVITVVAATQKNIVYIAPSDNINSVEQSFTLPADFKSLISLEAFGSFGTSAILSISNSGGSGGGAYAKTLGASVTASMVAGSTVVYYLVGSQTSGIKDGQDSYIRIGTSGAPSSVTDGVLAKGSLAVSGTTGASGGATASSVGDTKYAGGKGGNGGATYNTGGGGGLAGPLGAGGNGGAGYSASTRGDGGGGASNGGSAGGAGTNTAGGTGGTITGGTGGTGATSSSAATSGTNGGGGGGGFGLGSFLSGADGGILNNSIYTIRGGGGSDQGPGRAIYSTTSLTYNLGFGLVVFTYEPSSDVTTALTGGSATASSGTLTTSQTLTQALSSGSANALAGTLTASQAISQALSSVSVSASAGILGTSTDQIVGLNSASAAAYGGTLTNSQIAVQALTGVSASGQTSSFPIFLELVGAQAAASTGTLNYINTGWQLINTGGTVLWTDIDTQQT